MQHISVFNGTMYMLLQLYYIDHFKGCVACVTCPIMRLLFISAVFTIRDIFITAVVTFLLTIILYTTVLLVGCGVYLSRKTNKTRLHSMV